MLKFTTAFGLALALMGGTFGFTSEQARAQSPPVTFNKDIAPLVFDRCASCHQPGGLGPFSVLTYASVRQHATQIGVLTKGRAMPPWKAQSDYGEFVGQHPLSDAEIDLIQRWLEQGAGEGDPRDRPPVPTTTDGWELGKPDLIVTLPQAYVLQAEGTSVFRNFVIPVAIDGVRYVKGLEFHSGNARVVHHANVRIDPRRPRVALTRRIPRRVTRDLFQGRPSTLMVTFWRGHRDRLHRFFLKASRGGSIPAPIWLSRCTCILTASRRSCSRPSGCFSAPIRPSARRRCSGWDGEYRHPCRREELHDR